MICKPILSENNAIRQFVGNHEIHYASKGALADVSIHRKTNVIIMTIKVDCQSARDPRASGKLVERHKNLLTENTGAHR
jgi:hypothetical protein